MSAEDASRRRAEAAARWQPDVVRLLLVAEAPPSALDRYFYFENVSTRDSLFRYVTKGLLGAAPPRDRKSEVLVGLKKAGVFLIDVKSDPVDCSALSDYVPDLVSRCRELQPERIILIKATVYDAAFRPLRDAGLPVVDHRIPFPGSGNQRLFEVAFETALLTGVVPVSLPLARDAAAPTVAPPSVGKPTLHVELLRILREAGREMTTVELAQAVNDAANYRKVDGSPVTAFQVHGRTRKYPHLFRREGNRVDPRDE